MGLLAYVHLVLLCPVLSTDKYFVHAGHDILAGWFHSYEWLTHDNYLRKNYIMIQCTMDLDYYPHVHSITTDNCYRSQKRVTHVFGSLVYMLKSAVSASVSTRLSCPALLNKSLNTLFVDFLQWKAF